MAARTLQGRDYGAAGTVLPVARKRSQSRAASEALADKEYLKCLLYLLTMKCFIGCALHLIFRAKSPRLRPAKLRARHRSGRSGIAANTERAAGSFAQAEHIVRRERRQDADNKYADWTRQRHVWRKRVPDAGSSNAVQAAPRFEEQARHKREEFKAGLSPEAANPILTLRRARLISTLNSSIQHTASERKSWFNQTSEARIVTFSQDAVAAGTDHKKANAAFQAGIEELKHQVFYERLVCRSLQSEKQRLVLAHRRLSSPISFNPIAGR